MFNKHFYTQKFQKLTDFVIQLEVSPSCVSYSFASKDTQK